MRIRIPITLLSIVCLLLSLANFQPSLAQSRTGLAHAKPEVEQLIKVSGAEVASVAVYDLKTKQTLLINERASLHAASTMKLPVMMEIFRLVAAKKLDLNEPVEVKNEFHSIIDGSEYSLSPSDDSDAEVYQRIGSNLPLIELIRHMITRSSNLATNLLIEKVKAENVNRLMRSLGANDIQVLRGVEDSKAFQAGKNNTTTAYDLMLLLRLLAEKKFLNKSACQQMINILLAQEFNSGIPAALPAGTRVAHKTGEITKHDHDAAIVFPTDHQPYVIVVLTKGLAEHKVSSKLIADISRMVYQALVMD